jgi:diguanylate cyclase (GGDEF)-like protein
VRSAPPAPPPDRPDDPSIRRTWWFLVAAFVFLGVSVGARLLGDADLLDWVPAVAVAVAAVAAVAHRNAVAGLEARGRGEAESFARILHGLSRSVSADAIVGAILGDLADAVDADHAVVVRRRPDGAALEAVLVTRRAGVPPTSAVLPVADLDGPGPDDPAVPHPRHAVAGPPAGGEDAPRGARVHAVPLARADEILADALEPLPVDRPSWLRRARHELVGLLRDLGLPVGPGAAADLGPRSQVLGSPVDGPPVERVTARLRAMYGLANTLAAPLRTDDGLAGAILVSRRTHDPWPDSARRLVLAAASEASAAMARARSLRAATVGATTDTLTGLPNRRYFEEFSALMAQRRRSGDAVAVLMIDIDRFKALNDRFGHPVGDVVLRAVAGAIARAVRDEDVPARWGGEEFAVLLRNPGPDVAAAVGERIRVAVRELDLAAVGVGRVTVSVGVADARHPGDGIDAVVDRADHALLRAKRTGRDRVIAG